MTTPRNNGYSAFSIIVHWVWAIIVVTLFVTHEGERGSAVFNFHVSIGAVLGLFLLWRVWHGIHHGMTG